MTRRAFALHTPWGPWAEMQGDDARMQHDGCIVSLVLYLAMDLWCLPAPLAPHQMFVWCLVVLPGGTASRWSPSGHQQPKWLVLLYIERVVCGGAVCQNSTSLAAHWLCADCTRQAATCTGYLHLTGQALCGQVLLCDIKNRVRSLPVQGYSILVLH